MGKLMILFKDKGIPSSDFEHLADLVIYNQWVAAPGQTNPVRFVEFRADTEELSRMAWFAEFSQNDILYILDEPQDIRERLVKSAGTIGEGYKFAHIILVQMYDELFCIRNTAGLKIGAKVRFSISSKSFGTVPNEIPPLHAPSRETDVSQELAILETVKQAKQFESDLIVSMGGECHECGNMNQPVLGVYVAREGLPFEKYFESASIIRFGKLRDFDEIYQQAKEKGRILCLNCAKILRMANE